MVSDVTIRLDGQLSSGKTSWAVKLHYAADDLEVFKTGSGNDTFYGNDQANIFYGNAGADTAYAFGGNDSLVGGSGNDALWGGD